jgi:hypothetical protein
LDESYPGAGKILLAEANMRPHDTRAYFGSGDEFHMAFNFPIMPRMFMALQLEDRKPLVDVLAQTPDIPDSCQWGLFLRNHDELTLEMVHDYERRYMLDEYAQHDRARINLGIRRRLAPLLGGDRRRIELMNALLMSLPGSPIIYYGDEIGMGDNIYLGDRNGVRTPMQWDGGWNAGFSSADPEQLYQPLVANALYGYQSINVAAQLRNPSSLLNWMRRIIQVRKSSKAFGRGAMRIFAPANHRIFAYVRHSTRGAALVAARTVLRRGDHGGADRGRSEPRALRRRIELAGPARRHRRSVPADRRIHEARHSGGVASCCAYRRCSHRRPALGEYGLRVRRRRGAGGAFGGSARASSASDLPRPFVHDAAGSLTVGRSASRRSASQTRTRVRTS